MTLLSKLNPEPMSAEGISECLHQPQLTAAWLAYVNDPDNGVQNPAAYLRRQVRRGKYPPLQAAACLPIPNCAKPCLPPATGPGPSGSRGNLSPGGGCLSP